MFTRDEDVNDWEEHNYANFSIFTNMNVTQSKIVKLALNETIIQRRLKLFVKLPNNFYLQMNKEKHYHLLETGAEVLKRRVQNHTCVHYFAILTKNSSGYLGLYRTL